MVAVAAADAGQTTGTKLPPLPEGDIPNLASTLDQVVAALKRYVHFAHDEQADTVALWIAHTYLIQHFETSPKLAIRAPSKQSGKTRLCEVIKELAFNGWHVVGPSAAVVYRSIEVRHPTIILDEADRLFEHRQEDVADLLQLLNAGHARGSVVPRVVGPRHELHDFDAFAAVALAGIGTDWPDTILDRSVVINMERKTTDEPVARLRRAGKAALRDLAVDLASAVAAVTSFYVDDLPDELSDRAQDSWEPLLAIANAAGANWPTRARQAAVALAEAGATSSTEREEMLLLRDVRAIFEKEEDPAFLATKHLHMRLLAMTESPWIDNGFGRGLTIERMCKHLRVFGIQSSPPPKRGDGRGFYLAAIDKQWGRLRTTDAPLADLVPTPTTDGGESSA
jgi:hypothetical protein